MTVKHKLAKLQLDKNNNPSSFTLKEVVTLKKLMTKTEQKPSFLLLVYKKNQVFFNVITFLGKMHQSHASFNKFYQ